MRLTCNDNQCDKKDETQEGGDNRGTFPGHSSGQPFAEVEGGRVVMMDWRIVHGGPGRQHRVATHVVSLVALQCVFCGRRTRRTALVIDRGSFIYIWNGE